MDRKGRAGGLSCEEPMEDHRQMLGDFGGRGLNPLLRCLPSGPPTPEDAVELFPEHNRSRATTERFGEDA
jgi:hypothetical protein